MHKLKVEDHKKYIILLLFLGMLISSFAQSTINSGSNNNICNQWTLVKITVISDKVEYHLTDGHVHLNFNCKTNSYELLENEKTVNSGEWKLNNSTLEFISHGEKRNAIITKLTKDELEITFPDEVRDYISKNR